MHFIQTLCCCRLKFSESDRVIFIIREVILGDEDPGLTIAAIRKILEVKTNKAEACSRDAPLPYQATHKADNMDVPLRSLEHPGESAKNLPEVLRQGFIMGIRMAQF